MRICWRLECGKWKENRKQINESLQRKLQGFLSVEKLQNVEWDESPPEGFGDEVPER